MASTTGKVLGSRGQNERRSAADAGHRGGGSRLHSPRGRRWESADTTSSFRDGAVVPGSKPPAAESAPPRNTSSEPPPRSKLQTLPVTKPFAAQCLRSTESPPTP